MPEYTIARYKKGGKKFEVLVDPDKALEYKLGRRRDFTNILVFDEVYLDANKGLRASKTDLMNIFGTTDIEKIAERIVREGDLLIKTEQRRKLVEEKKRQIIDYISRFCVDSRTSAPLPPLRIERALEEVGVKIDPFRTAEEQVNDVISELAKVIPIKRQISILTLRIPPVYVGKVYGYIKNTSDILKEDWMDDGSLNATVSIPSGLKVDFMEKVSRLTGGSVFVEIVEEKTI
ncbi:TPA: ribosome assembly factor SBDS [Candidatus Geothermarchaeota archaeon]|nr:ribosome assembly factor SBDS [Candidatus Geothermarchaeota archaeon]